MTKCHAATTLIKHVLMAVHLEKEIMGLGHLPSESDMPAEIELHKVGNRPDQYAENSPYEMDLSSKP